MCNGLCSWCCCSMSLFTGVTLKQASLSLDHRQLHLSQLAATAFSFLVSTSISWFRNIAHASVSKKVYACVSMGIQYAAQTGKQRKRVIFDTLLTQLLYTLTDTQKREDKHTRISHAHLKKRHHPCREDRDFKCLFVYVSGNVGVSVEEGGKIERKMINRFSHVTNRLSLT